MKEIIKYNEKEEFLESNRGCKESYGQVESDGKKYAAICGMSYWDNGKINYCSKCLKSFAKVENNVNLGEQEINTCTSETEDSQINPSRD